MRFGYPIIIVLSPLVDAFSSALRGFEAYEKRNLQIHNEDLRVAQGITYPVTVGLSTRRSYKSSPVPCRQLSRNSAELEEDGVQIQRQEETA